MGTIADKLTYLANTKTAIKNALKSIGVGVGSSDTFRSYATKITNITYAMPSDWLSLPSMTNGDQKIALLCNVYGKSGLNYDNSIAFTITTSTGSYRVDWGDGTTTDYTSGTQAEHNYTYSTLSATVTSRGYKQVIIIIIPLTGNLVTANFTNRPSTYPSSGKQPVSGLVACKAAGSTITSMTMGTNTSYQTFTQSLEYFEFVGTCGITSGANMFYNCNLLQYVIGLETVSLSSVNSMFYSCNALRYGPVLNTSAVTDFTSMFANCRALTWIPTYNTSNGIRFSSMFSGCTSLAYTPGIVTTKGTSITSMYLSCSSINEINLDMAAVTSAAALNNNWNNYGLKGLNITNMPSTLLAVNVTGAQLNRDALVALFNSLYNRTSLSAATITITSCIGASSLSAADRAIATNKNWTITG